MLFYLFRIRIIIIFRKQLKSERVYGGSASAVFSRLSEKNCTQST